jgi:GxxExxY protein
MLDEMTPHKSEAEIDRLADTVRQTCFEIHRFLKHGHLEKVYENPVTHRLRKLGLTVYQQFPLTVHDEDGTVLGDYFADLFVENSLVVEIKACKSIVDEHLAQLLGYLRSSGIEHGLLINFGASIFQIRKLVLKKDD